VAHNPEKPMIIETGNLRVKVLGTSFDLINYPESDEVLLYLQEGKVLFYSIVEFDKKPLSDVFSVLEKTYGIQVLGAESYKELLLTARYQDETVDSIFESLQVIFGIHFTYQNNQVVLQ